MSDVGGNMQRAEGCENSDIESISKLGLDPNRVDR